MRKVLVLSVLGVLFGAGVAQAQFQPRPQPQPRPENRRLYLDRSYQNLRMSECNLTYIKLIVRGDNVRIENLDVLSQASDAYGLTGVFNQDVQVREHIAEGSQTHWKRLTVPPSYSRGSRCVIGIDLDARSDRDGDRALIEVVGLQPTINGDLREVLLDTISVREHRMGRERHRRQQPPPRRR
jgi:hypothetical protein